MSTEKLRAAFEAWAAKETPPYRLERVLVPVSDLYAWNSTACAWEAFQAGAASVPTTEPGIGEDVYDQLCDMIAPYVTDREGGLPGSVTESFHVLLDHWKAAHAQPTAEPVAQWVSVQEWQKLADVIRASGYVTRSQSREIADAIVAAQTAPAAAKGESS